MPLSATCMRRRPSNGNGLVTTATVRMPISFASCATTGAAPVPVPPPMPAVMNTMSAPCSASMMRSRSSSAAWRPTSGFAPAPRPLVTLLPSCSCSLAPQFLIACESVLAVMNSTPSMLPLTMCATALPPPPPTPTTLMTAFGAIFSTSSKYAMSVSSSSYRCRCCCLTGCRPVKPFFPCVLHCRICRLKPRTAARVRRPELSEIPLYR
jgi:hypothetical protein